MIRWLPLGLACAVACAGGAPPPPPAPREPLPQSPAGVDRALIVRDAAALATLAAQACACDDEPCLLALDEGIARFARETIQNDAVTNVETWPWDLDAMGQAMISTINHCARQHDFVPRGFAILGLRKLAVLRDAACACVDAPCAHRMLVRFDDISRGRDGDPETQASIDELSTQILACTSEQIAAQMVLDLKELRSDACACEDFECARQVAPRVESFMRTVAEHDAWAAALPPGSPDVLIEAVRCLGALDPR